MHCVRPGVVRNDGATIEIIILMHISTDALQHIEVMMLTLQCRPVCRMNVSARNESQLCGDFFARITI